MTDAEKTKLQREVRDSLKERPHGRLLLAPRTGKTKIAIDIIKRDKPLSILWVTPSSKLADEDIPAEFIKWKAKRYIKKLTTVTWMSLHKIVGRFDMIILDEEQFMTENNISTLLDGSLQYGNILSMTGSPTEKEEKNELYRMLDLTVIYRLSINAAVDIGLLSNYQINVVITHMETTKDLEIKTKKFSFKTSEVDNYDYLSRQLAIAIEDRDRNLKFKILARMRAIKNSPAKHKVAEYLIKNLKGRKLFFTSSINQAEALCKNTYHSKTDNIDLQRFMSGDIDTIAMVNAGGTGFTYKELDHLVITQVDSNKNGLTSQKIARTLLKQQNYKATIWIIALEETQDIKWIQSALKSFDSSKVNYMDFKILNLKYENK